MRTGGKDMLLGDPVGISLADRFSHWGRENQGKILWCHLFHEAVVKPVVTLGTIYPPFSGAFANVWSHF